MDNNKAVIVVLGMDAESRPHASSFGEADAVAAAHAAQLMGFHAVLIEDEALRQLTTSLPAGKIFATGRGLVPFVKRELYDKLAGLIGTASELKPERNGDGAAAGEPAAPEANGSSAANKDPAADVETTSAGEPQPETKAETATDPWSAITLGSTVLVASPYEDEGWFEAVVTGIGSDGDTLTMRWRDYPSVPLASTHRSKVAVIGPGAR